MNRPGVSLAEFDHARFRPGPFRLAGVDEAGRGCLAGPVVAGAVLVEPGWCPDGLDDSKTLGPAARTRLFAAILDGAPTWGAFAVWPREIDRINILRASLAAMAGAVRLLGPPPDLLLVDGPHAPPVDLPCECVVKGDARSAAVAAGAIVAKVIRDRIMTDLDARYPGYGFAAHKGYGSPEHLAALETLGPAPIHRFSFKPVAALSQTRLW